MEGVGARLGRSSTRYVPATIFTGRVRKWKKRWIPCAPHNANNGNNHNHHHHSSAASNGAATNGNSGSHLLLYKWAPITPSPNGNNNGNGNGNGNGKSHVHNNNNNNNNDESKDGTAASEHPRKRRYIPVFVLEELKNEALEHVEDEAKAMETETEGAEPISMNDDFDGKPDINDVPAEESQVQESDPLERQDLNESTLDLSLGLKARDGEKDSDSNQNKDG